MTTHYGEILRRVEEAKQWAIGDWLADGKRHYGDGLYKKAAEVTGMTPGTLMSFVSMAASFEFSLRRENLCYGHHKEVQGIKQIATAEDGKLNLARRHLEPHEWGAAFLMLLKERGVKRGQGARNDKSTCATVAQVAEELGVPLRTAQVRMKAADDFASFTKAEQDAGLHIAQQLRNVPHAGAGEMKA